MSIEGRIAVDVSFADSATSSGVQSVKKIALVEATSYTSGKVAIVTGTCDTSTTNLVSVTTPGYTNASGDAVSFSNITRVAFQATRYARLFAGLANFGNSSGSVSVSDIELPVGATHFNPRTTAGTASYTLVLYGS